MAWRPCGAASRVRLRWSPASPGCGARPAVAGPACAGGPACVARSVRGWPWRTAAPYRAAPGRPRIRGCLAAARRVRACPAVRPGWPGQARASRCAPAAGAAARAARAHPPLRRHRPCRSAAAQRNGCRRRWCRARHRSPCRPVPAPWPVRPRHRRAARRDCRAAFRACRGGPCSHRDRWPRAPCRSRCRCRSARGKAGRPRRTRHPPDSRVRGAGRACRPHGACRGVLPWFEVAGSRCLRSRCCPGDQGDAVGQVQDAIAHGMSISGSGKTSDVAGRSRGNAKALCATAPVIRSTQARPAEGETV